MFVDVSERSLSSSILGLETGLPFGIAPMGMCGLAWPGADRDLAIEAARRRMPLCVSTASSMTLEQINEIAEGHAWFQLYADQSGDFVNELVDRAAAAAYDVLILTVDVPIPSVRLGIFEMALPFQCAGASNNFGILPHTHIGPWQLWHMRFATACRVQ